MEREMKLDEYKKELGKESETSLNRKCVHYAESLGFDAYRMNSGRVKVKGGWFYGQKKSCPDFLFDVHNCFVWFEGKKQGLKAEEHQFERHQELKSKGHFVICTDSLDEFIKHFSVVERICRNNIRRVVTAIV